MWRLARHEDRLTEGCNKVALLLTANTPLFPLYLWFILGRDDWPWLLLTELSLPFFAVTILLGKRNGLVGRVWLCTFASINSFWVAWLLGPHSGIALFFLPCLVLNVLAFRDDERVARALFVVLPFALFLGLDVMPHAPAHFSAAENAGLLKLSGFSVACLSVVLPYLLGDARGKN